MKMKIILVCTLITAVFILFQRADLVAQVRNSLVKLRPPALSYNPYKEFPVYQGNDLGVTYSKSKTIFKIWSPAATAMKLKIYKTCHIPSAIKEIQCQKDSAGVWQATLTGDYNYHFYTFQAKIDNNWSDETPDPYSRALGTNGKRGQILDFSETNPKGWNEDKRPPLKSPLDVIIYETHIRDLTVSPNSGIKNKGKFMGLTETGTKNDFKQSTGIDHIAEMGVTHVHLLPVFDFTSVDESKSIMNEELTDDPEMKIPPYNWGYDPQFYNTPEGSYSSNPENGITRILEFKSAVQALHRKGLRVVMDVVYNHTGQTAESCFNRLVPGYYYRQWEKDGKYSNASGCGNEIASDRFMARRFIVESAVYWAKEYHIDGFRFDLMGIHDLETMNQVVKALKDVDPTIIVYGEGWTAGDSPLPQEFRAIKSNVAKMPGVAVFSDDIRDAVKGSVFDEKSLGFVNGSKNSAESLKFGIVAAGQHRQVNYDKVNYSKAPYTKNPGQVINYVSCHDNQTLYDKLKASRPDAPEELLILMDKLAATIIFTSQGIPFMFSGEEMKRTKGGEHNSYNKPDSVNQIDWNLKSKNEDLVEFYKGLISLRKAHPAFRLPSRQNISESLVFLPDNDPQVVAYQLKNHANGDPWSQIIVIFNGSEEKKAVAIPEGKWNSCMENSRFVKQGNAGSGSIAVLPCSATILYRE